MAASPSSVLSRGLGSWGSVNLLSTLGYGSSASVSGPACWAAGGVYLPDFKAGELYIPDFQAGEAYEPGFQEGQRDC